MNVLRFYCDESGTMPINDNDPPFVAATVAILGDFPDVGARNGRISWLLEKLEEFEVIPYVAYVQPKPGFSIALEAKLSKLNTMARYRRLMDGANNPYLNPEGFRPRNFIWLHCMQQAVARGLAIALFKHQIDRIELYLDEKTLTEPESRLMLRQGLRVSVNFHRVLEALRRLNPGEIEQLQNNLRTSELSTSLYWNNESSSVPAQGGLTLAHYLSSHARRNFENQTNNGILNSLREKGFTHFFDDITDVIMAPIAREVVERWRSATGLPEPE
jgi:hypothetical protein